MTLSYNWLSNYYFLIVDCRIFLQLFLKWAQFSSHFSYKLYCYKIFSCLKKTFHSEYCYLGRSVFIISDCVKISDISVYRISQEHTLLCHKKFRHKLINLNHYLPVQIFTYYIFGNIYCFFSHLYEKYWQQYISFIFMSTYFNVCGYFFTSKIVR